MGNACNCYAESNEVLVSESKEANLNIKHLPPDAPEHRSN